MGLIVSSQSARRFRCFGNRHILFFYLLGASCILFTPMRVVAQASFAEAVSADEAGLASPVLRARNFLGGRRLAGNASAAQAMDVARRQHVTMLAQQAVLPRLSSLNAAWQPLGPEQVASAAYGNVTGRVAAIAIDPADATGNTVYLGTTGGGVWKSTNAAGPAANVTFTPLTDTLPVFSPNAGSAAVPSLSIGAVSVQPGVQAGVVLAGTGDPNDSSDSFYGSGLLRSADGGLTWTLIRNSQDGVNGNHSFAGLGFAGFAWSSTSPGTVVAAVSQAAQGVLVNAPSTTNSVMGLYYSADAGVTWQMGILMDGGQVVQTPQPSGANRGGNAQPQSSGIPYASGSTRLCAITATTSQPMALPGRVWPTNLELASPQQPALPAPIRLAV